MKRFDLRRAAKGPRAAGAVVVGLLMLLALLACSGSGGGSSPTAPPTPGTVVVSLPVPLVAQERPEWCWAAGAQMVLQYYGRSMSQCQLATKTKGDDIDCCRSVSERCLLKDALGLFVVGLYDYNRVDYQVENHPLPWVQIRDELDQGRPVAAFFAGSGVCRMAIIHGYTTNQFVQLHDPALGSFTVPYGSTLAYDGGRVWTDSVYDLRPAS